ncbi:MAG: thiol:disulfide interchange protein [Crocinitomix sp.]|nr:thiol:disulfide interchange protein [Crocinitomix sp.]
MLKQISLIFLALFATISFAQDEMPNNIDDVITWSWEVEYTSADEATITMRVAQKNGWHIYSQIQPEGAIPLPTEFDYNDGKNLDKDFKLVGATKEYGAELIDNDGFPERSFHGNRAKFVQKIKILSKKDFEINLYYGYMACKTACLAPEYRNKIISIKGTDNIDAADFPEAIIDGGDEAIIDSLDIPDPIISPIGFQAYSYKITDTEYELVIKPEVPEKWFLLNDVQINYSGEIDNLDNANNNTFKDTILLTGTHSIYNGGEFRQTVSVDTSKEDFNSIIGTISFSGLDSLGNKFISEQAEVKISLDEALDKPIDSSGGSDSYWGIFWLAFGGGLFALLTPCVFPMIPMTVSFFTKGSENKKKGLFRGVMYGFFILLIYVLLSVPFHLMDSLNPNILNNIATNGPLNIFFFIMLFVFALSFLGAFEIVLPAKWTNKADKKSDLGGLIGIFFMALTLALVSFSCTGPILGSLLASASGGGAWNLTWGMAGFGLALGLPFALFAIFPSWLNGLPKSGGWLNNVKVVLGFLELAFAFKFLSNADLSIQAHLLERELFIAIWVAIFAALTLYLFGLFQTKHDSPITGGLGTFRVMIATLSLMFTVYMIPGMFGAPLKMISAFPPPPSYSEIPYGIHGTPPSDVPEGAEYEHGMAVFHDLDAAEKYAAEVDKPLMLDFTGLNCVNCRKMEVNVWSDESVHHIMADEFVVVSLFIDERTALPKPEISPYSGMTLTTKGEKWADLQSSLYGKATQPQYIALDRKGNQINQDATYKSHGKPVLFKKWLEDAATYYETPVFYGTIIYE